MRPFINYSLYVIERCSKKVQCNRLIPKPPHFFLFTGGRREGKKKKNGQVGTVKIFDQEHGPGSKEECHQRFDSSLILPIACSTWIRSEAIRKLTVSVISSAVILALVPLNGGYKGQHLVVKYWWVKHWWFVPEGKGTAARRLMWKSRGCSSEHLNEAPKWEQSGRGWSFVFHLAYTTLNRKG